VLAELARRQAAATQYAEMISANDTLARQNSFQYGKMTLQSIFLLNGGALISLLAFMGNVASSEATRLVPRNFLVGFCFYVAGLVLVVFSMLLAYFNYMHLARDHSDPGALSNSMILLEGTWPTNSTDENTSRISGSFNGAIILGIGSVLAFIAGSVSIAMVL
jgi:hypothetical protein